MISGEGKDRWRTVLEIYEAAADLPPEQRRAFVESHSDSDWIASEVFELLARLEARTEPSTAPQPPPPSKIGRYIIQELLGRGGMGEVYSARDTELDRTVALKLLSSETLDNGSVKRLIWEAKAASALNHPNIVTVHEIIDTGFGLAIVMEAVSGVPLRKLTGQSMPVSEVLKIGRQVAEALAAAHHHGIVHRDIKPENIMVREDGYVKLLDFGLARKTDGAQSTSGLIPAGTLRYMSPEQARGEKAGRASDIFSLGIVLYELATGRHPFPGTTAFETAHAICTMEPQMASASQPLLPPRLTTLIASMLHKSPEARPVAAGVVEELNAVGMAATAAKPFSRRLPAAALMLVLAIGGWIAWRPRPSTVAMLSPIPLTTDSGYEYEPRLSPDGKQIAYTRGRTGAEPAVVVQEIGSTSSPVRVIARNAYSPAWSPRGDVLAVLRNQPADRDLHDILLINRSGDVLRRIAEIRSPGAFQDWAPSPYIDFSPDGRYLVACDGWGPRPSSLVIISVETGDKSPLTTPATNVMGDFSPRFSPDGRRVAFTRVRRYAAADIFVLALKPDMRADGLPIRIASDELWNGFPVWTAKSDHLLFASGLLQGARLKLVRVPGGVPITLPVAESAATPLDLRHLERPGRSRIVYTRLIRDNNIIHFPLDAEKQERRTAPSRIADSSFIDEMPHYSPDGNQIAFRSNRTGTFQVWLAEPDGSNARQVSRLRSADIGSLTWSPDSQHLALQVTLPEWTGVYEMNVSNGETRRLVEGAADGPSYTPDGEYLLYGSRKLGKPQIWRVAVRGGSPEPYGDVTADTAQLAPDGKTLVFVRGLELFVRPEGGPTTRVFRQIYSQQSFAVTRSAVFAVARRNDTGPWTVIAWRFATRRAEQVAQMEKAPGNGITVSPDERTLLVSQLEHLILDLMMLDDIPDHVLAQ